MQASWQWSVWMVFVRWVSISIRGADLPCTISFPIIVVPHWQVDVDDDGLVEFLATYVRIALLHNRCVDDTGLTPAHSTCEGAPVASPRRGLAAEPECPTADLGINASIRPARCGLRLATSGGQHGVGGGGAAGAGWREAGPVVVQSRTSAPSEVDETEPVAASARILPRARAELGKGHVAAG